MDQLLREKATYENYIESMTMEKEEMIRTHTIETGELRKKVSVLTDHVQRLEGAAMHSAAVPGGNHHFGAHYDEMDGMAMPGAWDSVGMFNEFAPVEAEVKQEPAHQLVKKGEIPFPADMDKSSSHGGLIFWLFLIGAFVISSKGSTPSIPPVSEDVRATSATLLESVLKDAGVGGPAAGMDIMAPQPSAAAAWNAGPAGMGAADSGMDGVMPSMLGELGDQLTQPTQEQTNEQLFSLSAAQYSGVVGGASQDFLQAAPAPEQRSTSQGRRNLAEAMAQTRTGGKQHSGAADVYSRTLLWDQIPADVVRNFAKMVAECNSAQNEQRNDART